MRLPSCLHVPTLLLVPLLASWGCPGGDGTPDAGDTGPPNPIPTVDAGNPLTRDAGPVVCEDDGAEENDTPFEATSLASGQQLAARFCGGDDDWYALATSAGCSVSIDVTQEVDGIGDIDVVAIDPRDQVVASASSVGAVESLRFVAADNGRYAFRVRGGDRDDIGYGISVFTVCDGDLDCPADDRFEENDDRASASELRLGVAVDAMVCGTDLDTWAIPVAVGCMADVHATFTHSDGDIDIKLLSATGEQLVAGASSDDDERVRDVVQADGVVAQVVLFRGSDPNIGNKYTLVVDDICLGDLSCPSDDPFEDNDALARPVTIGNKDEVIGMVCGTDEDYYRVSPQNGCDLVVDVLFSHADGDIDLRAMRTDGSTLAAGASTDDDEHVEIPAGTATPVILHVKSYETAGGPPSQNRYRLRTQSVCP